MSRPLSYSSVSSINHAWEAVANQIGFAIFGDSSSKEVKSDPTYVFLEPVLRVTADERGSSVWSASGLRQRSLCHWDALSKLISFLDSKPTHLDEASVPFAFGMLSYELLHLIENVPRNKTGPIPPYLYDFYLYKRILRIDHTISEFVYTWPEYHNSFWENSGVVIPEISSIDELLSSKSYLESEPDSLSLEEFSNFSMRAYINSVSDIKSRIRKGDVYQVNLSQRFTLPFEQSAFEYYRALRQVSPSRFGGYFSTQNHSGPVAIASASPELFFSANDQSVSCSPIKGTRRRSPDAFLDIQIQNELKSSEKDLAELAMIVDLVRNDLGRVCKIGSIDVTEHARLESFAQVHHLVSDISGILDKKCSMLDLVKAVFPCGSITGAPKIAAMKVISELESINRGAYTGAMGYLSGHRNALFNVAIRTTSIGQGVLSFNAGGGIVIDSDPESEYFETLAKASGQLTAYHAILRGKSFNGESFATLG